MAVQSSGNPISASTHRADSACPARLTHPARFTCVARPSPAVLLLFLLLWLPFVVGVAHGKHEGSEASVRCPHIRSSEAPGLDPVAKGQEIVLHTGQPRSLARGDVFDDDAEGSQFVDDPGVLKPQSGSVSAETDAFAGGGDILAGEASAEDVDGGKVGSSNCLHIGKSPRFGPVPRQHLQAKRIALDLPDHLAQAGSLKP